MTIALAERLKRDWTDKYVVVQENVPELRRFVGLTGQVKTVNMNGRVLVQFDGPVDIGWYDIDPGYLKVVAAPQPKKAREHTGSPAPEPVKTEKPKPAAGKSPLEMARQQGAGGAAASSKPSPQELARKQGANKGGSAPAPTGEKKLSPLEMARQQGAIKAGSAPQTKSISPVEPPSEVAAVAPNVEASPPVASAPPVETKPAVATPSSTAEILALARKQGPFQG